MKIELNELDQLKELISMNKDEGELHELIKKLREVIPQNVAEQIQSV